MTKVKNSWIKTGAIFSAISVLTGILYGQISGSNDCPIKTGFITLLFAGAATWLHSAFSMFSKPKNEIEFLPLATLIMLGAGIYTLFVCSGYFANLEFP